VRSVRVEAPGSPAANPAFDVTPARLVTSFVTERGIVEPQGLALLRHAGPNIEAAFSSLAHPGGVDSMPPHGPTRRPSP